MDDDFGTLLERHRREIRVHCYRMSGSFEEAEDLTQEAFLRAWKGRGGFEGRASVRTWLYRIATNVCLDALARRPRRVLPDELGAAADPAGTPAALDVPWLGPIPDALLDTALIDTAAPDDTGAAVVERETIELAFLAAIQHLPPRQRAALVLRDVLDWSAKDTAAVLETSVASANSALQRARETLRTHLPARRADWASAGATTAEEAELLRRFIAAYEAGDPNAVAELLREDARAVMPPYPLWFDSRERIIAALRTSMDPESPFFTGRFRMVAVRANRQPAVATWVCRPGASGSRPGESVFRRFGVSVLTVESGLVTAIAAFETPSFAPFGLPETLILMN
ncbi:RNA polymerase subunit sigma-70 [Amycolatopsis carbonis]|uniref:RNA polymerase sigma factor n=1 Tax=Amycolatopsis carbonis TaxID=715471 RepID=A0A9Y2N289_9PSEU|nr:RNA polymerase subunit sigma-70 [Amycolatopsis sp. 2-15]WIX83769.1 RNA polymerase subunit sigma-70 [Amycolatopsis sp. 2-15]